MMRFKRFYMERLLSEGGLGGHMTHPYDVLSPEDFLNFYDNLLSGNLAATEKVDGVNLFVGFNNDGKLTFARNATEKPSTNIASKFPEAHPAGDTFRAGFAALQKALEGLSPADKVKFQLQNEDGTKKNFINLEIMYGEIPNIIQYSDTDNFIVFHGFVGNDDEGYAQKGNLPKVLTQLAKKIKSVKVKSKVVSYFGELGKVKKVVETKPSNWIFTGQIDVPTDRIRNDLRRVAKDFKKFPEVKKIKNWEKLSQEELFDTMKSLTAKIGAEILISLSSELFKGVRKGPANHPKIEGLVVRFKDNLIKVTGDFAQMNQDLWKPLKVGLDKPLKEMNQFFLGKGLMIPTIASIKKQSWEKAGKSSEGFLKMRNPKFYADKKNLTGKIKVSIFKKEIDNTMKKLEKVYNRIAKGNNIKKDDILKALRLAAFKLNELKEKLKLVRNRVDLLSAFANTMFGLSA